MLASWEDAVRLNPHDAAMHAGLAERILLAKGEDRATLEEALDAYTRASKLNPSRPGYHLARARLSARLGRSDEARLAATEAIRLDALTGDATAMLDADERETARRLAGGDAR